jgi:putative two-component system response regulator
LEKITKDEVDDIYNKWATVEIIAHTGEVQNRKKDSQREIIFTMGSIGEARSKETGNHVKRVAEYSKLFVLKCGMTGREAEMLKQASPMHDIGKIAIPDNILNKLGKFNNEERLIMDTHAALGYNMLNHSDRELLKTAAIVSYEHHEKWDVFDALGSNRVYKKAWSDDRIFQMFRDESAKHFDPKLIDIFFDNVEEFLKIRDSMEDKLYIS